MTVGRLSPEALAALERRAAGDPNEVLKMEKVPGVRYAFGPKPDMTATDDENVKRAKEEIGHGLAEVDRREAERLRPVVELTYPGEDDEPLEPALLEALAEECDPDGYGTETYRCAFLAAYRLGYAAGGAAVERETRPLLREAVAFAEDLYGYCPYSLAFEMEEFGQRMRVWAR